MSDESENQNENKSVRETVAPTENVGEQSVPPPTEITPEPAASAEGSSEPKPETVSENVPVEIKPEIQREPEQKPESAGKSIPPFDPPAPSKPATVTIESPVQAVPETTVPEPVVTQTSKSFIKELLAKANYALRFKKMSKFCVKRQLNSLFT